MPKLNGSAARTLPSWIDAFVESTANLETPLLYRRWAAITLIGAVLEQKVWMMSPTELYPNLYTMLVGHPGVGKTRSIHAATKYANQIQDFNPCPPSVTSASLVDALVAHKRFLPTYKKNESAIEYNSMLIAADEFGVLLHKWDNQMVALLSAFYDTTPYGEQRRTSDIKIKMQRPLLSILSGSTPSNLMKFMPEGAWDQGFSSRIIMVFSDERIITDIFAPVEATLSKDLIHDLEIINSTYGQCEFTAEFREATMAWRHDDMAPAPTHPKLLHYATRRLAHMLKLAMISSIDRGHSLLLTKADFDRAKGWLLEVEERMPEIFKAGAVHADAAAMDDVFHLILTNDRGKGVAGYIVNRWLAERLPIHSVERALITMVNAGRIRSLGPDRDGLHRWTAVQD